MALSIEYIQKFCNYFIVDDSTYNDDLYFEQLVMLIFRFICM